MRRAVLLLLAGCSAAYERPPPPTFSSISAGPVWDDPGRCFDAVHAGRKLVRSEGRVRVGTWNIKWFPDGKPGKGPPEEGGTDIGWLACAIAYLDVDIIGLEEIKQTEGSHLAQAALLEKLEQLTGAKWSLEVDTCADPYKQHVAVLYRTDRLIASHPKSHGEIDPTVSKSRDRDPSCPGNLRPALGVYVKSKRGGADFHFVVLHLDSGREPKDFANREAAWQRFPDVFQRRQELVSDDDVVFAGDMNSMGCPDCGLQTPESERTKLVEVLGKLSPPLSVAEPTASCSQYYHGKGALLDHVIASRGMREADGQKEMVDGVCAKTGCARIENDQPVFVHLSDHCPVVLDLFDRDDDPPLEISGRP